jgi:hypothetical protein
MANENEIEAEGRRIWPDAKRVEVIQAEGATITAFNHDNKVIDSVSADSLDSLLQRLKDLLPDGGQAP